MKPLPTVARLHELFRYDYVTGNLHQRAANRYRGTPADTVVGHLNEDGYLVVMVDGHPRVAHRVCWAIHYGEWPTDILDHKNRNRTENWIDNLRLANSSQNTANSVRQGAMSATGRRGVRMCKGKPQAQIKSAGKLYHLGTFDSLDEAAHAYNRAAIALHGEFAVLNPIGEDKAGDLSNTKEQQA